MSELILIQKAKHGGAHGSHAPIPVTVDRITLSKRRWRGVAEDGREFGFDLDETLGNGDHFHSEGDRHYVIEQSPEDVLEIALTTPEQAARVAWGVGNLHFGVQVDGNVLRVVEDPAVVQFFAREHIEPRKVRCVFEPLSAAGHHHHHG